MTSNQTQMANTPEARVLVRAKQLVHSLFEDSQQSMYLYVDDRNKACNDRFAKLLGYANPEAWAAVHTPFPQAFVEAGSQGRLVDTYQDAVSNGVAAQVPITWKRKDGKPVDTQVILVPIEVEGRRVALHFIDGT